MRASPRENDHGTDHTHEYGVVMPGAADQFDFESLDPSWLRSKTGNKWRKHAPALPAWVADMDFRPAPAITEHLRTILDRGDLGYPLRDEKNRMRAVGAFAAHMQTRHGWSVDTDLVREWNDVVQAVQAILHVATEPGDGVVVHVPAYPPFFSAIEQTGCRLVPAPAIITDSRVSFDHDALDELLEHEHAQVLILCNPHNPTGHVFSRDELARLVEIAHRHDLTIVSDEIHADLVFDSHVHVPIAGIEGAAGRTVTVTSASKSFNLAGLRYAVTVCDSPRIAEAWSHMPDHLFGATNIVGAEAAWAAWMHAGDWLDAVVAHLERMRDLTKTLVREHLPGVAVHLPDATYLAWFDCSATAIAADPHGAFRAVGVETSDGTTFGPGGAGHVRFNFATSSEMVEQMVRVMGSALRP